MIKTNLEEILTVVKTVMYISDQGKDEWACFKSLRRALGDNQIKRIYGVDKRQI